MLQALVVAPKRKGQSFMTRQRIAYHWQDVFEMRHMSQEDFLQSLDKTSPLLKTVANKPSVVVFKAEAGTHEDPVLRVIPLPEEIEGDEKEVFNNLLLFLVSFWRV